MVMVLQGYLSDRYGKRHWHIQAGTAWTLLWYVLLVAVNHGDVPVALLFVCVYMVVPVLGISPIMMAWNNEIHQCDSGALCGMGGCGCGDPCKIADCFCFRNTCLGHCYG